mmetsp:Transcript_19918/g.49086  ORF Transcript_19918/g.49086 Transcript_19918/m.49086 type:complete len:87 (-) Transcript_19918:678-938(-)
MTAIPPAVVALMAAMAPPDDVPEHSGDQKESNQAELSLRDLNGQGQGSQRNKQASHVPKGELKAQFRQQRSMRPARPPRVANARRC